MSTSKKAPASIRQGGPGAFHENAKAPFQDEKATPDSGNRTRSHVSGGGGERDRHHARDPGKKNTTHKAD